MKKYTFTTFEILSAEYFNINYALLKLLENLLKNTQKNLLFLGISTHILFDDGSLITVGNRTGLKIDLFNVSPISYLMDQYLLNNLLESDKENNDLFKYRDTLNLKWLILDNYYKTKTINKIIFNYTLVDEEDYIRFKSKEKTLGIFQKSSQFYSEITFPDNILLPNNMNYFLWAENITKISYPFEINNAQVNKTVYILSELSADIRKVLSEKLIKSLTPVNLQVEQEHSQFVSEESRASIEAKLEQTYFNTLELLERIEIKIIEWNSDTYDVLITPKTKDNNLEDYKKTSDASLISFEGYHKFRDIKQPTKADVFIRFHLNKNNKEYYYIENNVITFYYKNNIATKFITPLAKSKTKNVPLKLITLDIETYLDKETKQMEVYTICFYDGKKFYSFYLGDYLNKDEMFLAFANKFLRRTYKGYIVYIHNSSNFDLVFLLKFFARLPNIQIQPIIKDGKFIDLKIIFKDKIEASTLAPVTLAKVAHYQKQVEGSTVQEATVNKEGKKSYNLTLRDSMLMLPFSLSDLAKTFKIKKAKGVFPYLFPQKDNLNYDGPFPDFETFDKINIEEYQKLANKYETKNWNLKAQTLKYCNNDCLLLYGIITKFSEIILTDFSINIRKAYTLPSLAFRLFRTNYLKNNKIPIITGRMYEDMSKAYFGGHVDMYKPDFNINNSCSATSSSKTWRKMHHYDVNSLYPAAMLNFLYPIGNIRYFIGDIFKNPKFNFDIANLEQAKDIYQNIDSLSKTTSVSVDSVDSVAGANSDLENTKAKHLASLKGMPDKKLKQPKIIDTELQNIVNSPVTLGVFYVKINCPDSILHPILPVRLEDKIIYPTGSWYGWYYSTELENAKKYGYQYEIRAGYLFDGTDLFSKYITDLHEIKKNSAKDSAWYFISKLLMNSLYGRFGMKQHQTHHRFIPKEESDKIIENIQIENVESVLDFGNTLLLEYNPVNDYNFNDLDLPPINIAVALSISANARVIMSTFKNKEDFDLYYSDTDSLFIVFINQDAYDSFQKYVDSKKLGFLKLENTIKEAIFIAPKAYALKTIDNKEKFKIKGFKKLSISFEKFYNLLIKDSVLELKQDLWFKNMIEANIVIKDSPYLLKMNNNKRNLVFDSNNRVIGTSSIKI